MISFANPHSTTIKYAQIPEVQITSEPGEIIAGPVPHRELVLLAQVGRRVQTPFSSVGLSGVNPIPREGHGPETHGDELGLALARSAMDDVDVEMGQLAACPVSSKSPSFMADIWSLPLVAPSASLNDELGDQHPQGARLPSQQRYDARVRTVTQGVRVPRALYEDILALLPQEAKARGRLDLVYSC